MKDWYLLLFCVSNIVCLMLGLNTGISVGKGENVELPKVDVGKKIRERQDRKEAEREREKYETIMRNIDNYDGTGRGQEDVPRG